MSAQNTHDIPAFYHVFISFHIVISVVITLYLLLGFLCTSCEKGGMWRLYEDLKKENGKTSSNFAAFRSDDVPIFINPTSRHCWDLISKILRYKGKRQVLKGKIRNEMERDGRTVEA